MSLLYCVVVIGMFKLFNCLAGLCCAQSVRYISSSMLHRSRNSCWWCGVWSPGCCSWRSCGLVLSLHIILLNEPVLFHNIISINCRWLIITVNYFIMGLLFLAHSVYYSLQAPLYLQISWHYVNTVLLLLLLLLLLS